MIIDYCRSRRKSVRKGWRERMGRRRKMRWSKWRRRSRRLVGVF